jgi:hypothetical protein
LKLDIQERLDQAGVEVQEARISHLAYASEIAAAMLQRQQASAIVAARSKIVEGAVGMVRMALDHLKQDNVVCADEGCTGYDEFFFIQSVTDIDGDNAMESVTSKSSQTTMKRAFSKSCASRNKGRVLVNRFIELIAR